MSRNRAEAKYTRWARAFVRGVQKTIRHLLSNRFAAPPMVSSRSISKATPLPRNKKRKGNKGVNNRQKGKLECGVELPRSYADVVRLDKRNGNRLW